MTDLPPGWEWSTLGEVVDVLDSRRVPINAAERAQRVGTVPYYGATGQVGWIDGALFEEELVLLGEDGAPFLDRSKRKAYLIDGPAWVNNHAHVLRANEATTNRFLKYQLDAVDFRPHVNGTTRLKLTQAAMREIPFLLPPQTEQEQIVVAIDEHLSRLDAAEASVGSAAARLSLHERASVASLLSARDDEWTSLGEIAEVRGGVTKDAKKQGDPTFVEVPYLRVANVQRGHLLLDQVTKIRVDQAKLDALRLQPGDMLFNEGGDRDKLGRGWVWEGQIDDCIHQNHVFRGRLISPDFDPYFVSTHANTWGQAWFEKHGRQTTNLASISLSTLKQIPVPAPSLDDQQRIVAALRDADEVRSRLERALDAAQTRAKALRRSILDAAFSGKLVPQDPADEPASVLLKRIRVERDAAGPRRRARS